MTDNITKRLNEAVGMLFDIYHDTKSTEVNDAIKILIEWHEQYLEDNDQFGAGA